MIRHRSSSTAILLAAALLASCSSGSREVTPTVPAYTPDEDQSTSAAAEPSESSTATDGPLTAEGLSDPAAEYTVSAIPEDLDETQTAVLRGYMAYDRATWDAYRAMDGDLSRVQAASTGDAWSTYRTEYQSAQDAGASMTGRYDLDIKFVSPVTPGDIFATVSVCADQSAIAMVNPSGADVTPETMRHRLGQDYMLELDDDSGSWQVSSWTEATRDKC